MNAVYRNIEAKLGAVRLGRALEVFRSELRVGAIAPAGEEDTFKRMIGFSAEGGMLGDDRRTKTCEIPCGKYLAQFFERP